MHASKLSTFVIAAVMAAPGLFAGSAAAQDRDNNRGQRQSELRMYDSARHDYHPWNDEEDRRYREYVREHHRKYRDFSRMSKKEQREYWQWRHEHDDRR